MDNTQNSYGLPSAGHESYGIGYDVRQITYWLLVRAIDTTGPAGCHSAQIVSDLADTGGYFTSSYRIVRCNVDNLRFEIVQRVTRPVNRTNH